METQNNGPAVFLKSPETKGIIQSTLHLGHKEVSKHEILL